MSSGLCHRSADDAYHRLTEGFMFTHGRKKFDISASVLGGVGCDLSGDVLAQVTTSCKEKREDLDMGSTALAGGIER